MGICGIGLGHASRSIPVAKELLRRGHSITFTAYGEAQKLLEKEGFQHTPNVNLSYGLSDDGSISVKRTILKNLLLPLRFAEQIARETSVMDKWPPDVVYSDTRASTVVAAKVLGRPVIVVLNQYNIALEVRRFLRLARYVGHIIQAPEIIWDRSDIIAVPDLPPPYTISKYTLNTNPGTRLEYVGPLIEKRQISSREVEQTRRRHNPDGKPLVFIHISGNRPERERLAAAILRVIKDLGRYRFVVSLGNIGGPTHRELGNVEIYDWVEDADALMAASDIVVGRAGLTVISKAILYGRKIVAIPTPLHGEQLRNALRVEELGIGKMLDEKDLASMGDILEELSHGEEYGRTARALSSIASRMDGVLKVADIIEGLGYSI